MDNPNRLNNIIESSNKLLKIRGYKPVLFKKYKLDEKAIILGESDKKNVLLIITSNKVSSKLDKDFNKMKKDYIKESDKKIDSYIFVYRYNLKINPTYFIDTFKDIKYELLTDIFIRSEVGYHITQPKVFILSKNEIDELKEQYITISKMPKIDVDDQLIKYYGIEQKNIIKFIRKDNSIYYRYVDYIK